jgi:Tfp pilus assembly PilM family ATPase
MNFRSLFASSLPPVAVGIGPDAVTGISVSRGPAALVVSGHASEPLPASAIEPVLNGRNVADRAALVAALRRVFERLGHPKRIALSVPDTVGKVSLLRFEKVPARADDLDQMIRWQIRKSAPFHVEEGQIAYTRGTPIDGGGREFVVVLARRDVVREYESACEEAGAHAGIVDLASFNVVNAALAVERPAGDWLLVHVTSHYATIAILRGADLIFYRSRGEESEGDLGGLVHQTAMYYEDRLGGHGFSKVVLVGGAAAYAGMQSGDWLRRNLEERLHTNVEVLRRERVQFADRIAVDAALFDRYAPLIGLLQRPS